MILHVTTELEPFKRLGALASWVRRAIEERGGRVLLLGASGTYELGGVEVVGVGAPLRVPVNDVVEEAFLELFTSLAEIPYKVDPSGVEAVEGHEWRGALVAYILALRLRKPFIYSVYTTEVERGGFGIVAESVKSIEEFLAARADMVVARRDGALRVLREQYGVGEDKLSPASVSDPEEGLEVLQVSWEYPPHMIGGLGRAVTHISMRLAEHAAVHVLTIGLPGSVRDERRDRLYVMRVDPFTLRSTSFVSWVYCFNFLMIAKALSEGVRPHIIHSHDWLTAPASVALKHLLKAPLIVTIHATEYGRSRGSIVTPLQRQIHYWEWRVCYEAWRVLVCSEWMKREVAAAFSLPEDKLLVLPNGINVEELDKHRPLEGERSRYALPWEKIVFFAGRHVYEKGVDVLLEAARIILSRRRDVKFVIAGDGPMRLHLMWLASRYGLGDKVFFTGRLRDDELYRAYKLADIVVIPSRYEPFGIVALEAMASGKPVVASNVGGLSEVVVNGETGLLVPPEDPEALARAIEELLENPRLAEEMGVRGRRRVEELYRWDKIVRFLEKIYRRVLEEYSVSGWHTLLDSYNN
ncbi:MAG: hypothetical protein DRK00_01640 [Thermoprotei archaeon]|nr:MAG: hypothetical protein DRK00_01640 [Thermoprotei archaeon]